MNCHIAVHLFMHVQDKVFGYFLCEKIMVHVNVFPHENYEKYNMFFLAVIEHFVWLFYKLIVVGYVEYISASYGKSITLINSHVYTYLDLFP